MHIYFLLVLETCCLPCLPVYPKSFFMNRPEDILQAKCWQWAWNYAPETRRCLAHVPNELERFPGETKQHHIIRIGQAKAKGLLPGVHDLFFYWKGQLYWFELKVGANQQSPEQIAFGKAMEAQGARCIEIRDLETFKNIFTTIIT